MSWIFIFNPWSPSVQTTTVVWVCQCIVVLVFVYLNPCIFVYLSLVFVGVWRNKLEGASAGKDRALVVGKLPWWWASQLQWWASCPASLALITLQLVSSPPFKSWTRGNSILHMDVVSYKRHFAVEKLTSKLRKTFFCKIGVAPPPPPVCLLCQTVFEGLL